MMPRARMTLRQYRRLAEFRYALRRFLHRSERLTRGSGLTPLQYQLLLPIKVMSARVLATIGSLSERLQAKHHGVVTLATRCDRLGLVTRRASPKDRRKVYLVLSPKGSRALQRLALAHRDDLLE